MSSYKLGDYTVPPADTFELPEDSVRRSLVEGCFAKLVFDEAERMWVKITKVVSEGVYEGELDNVPVCVDLECGAHIEFEWKHIIDFIPVDVVIEI